jgi:methyl-accepting chemotaxis protein
MFFRGAAGGMKLSHKLFIVITALNLLTISAFTYFTYTNQKKTVLRGIDAKLVSSAQGIKVALDSFHEKLRNPGGVTAGEYRKELDALTAFADGAGVKYAYSVMMKDGAIVFTTSSYTREELEKGELTTLFEPYKDAPAGLRTALEKNQLTFEQYSDKWGSFRSVFVPSRLPNGVSYAIGIDVGLDEIGSILRRTLIACLLIGFAVFAAGTVVALLVAWYISSGVRRIALHLSQVADGDLGVLIEKRSDDELGMLSQDLNRMVENLRMLVGSVWKASDSVVAAAGQFHATSRNMSAGVEEVAGQAELVATAAEEMAATSRSIADNCSSTAQSVKDTQDIAQTAEGVVQQTVAMMNSIAVLVQDSAVTVKGLGESSAQIGAIIATIEEIADQTNLLALNAAIEAARAGEQGRGFAVVADEVRRLAERTGKATREISMVIKAIQAKIGDAVSSMEEGVTQVTKGTHDAARSGEALQDIVKHSREITSQVNQVAVAASEQTATTDEISCNINQITTVAQTTVGEVKNSVAAAEQLTNLAEDLHTQIQQFKLPA